MGQQQFAQPSCGALCEPGNAEFAGEYFVDVSEQPSTLRCNCADACATVDLSSQGNPGADEVLHHEYSAAQHAPPSPGVSNLRRDDSNSSNGSNPSSLCNDAIPREMTGSSGAGESISVSVSHPRGALTEGLKAAPEQFAAGPPMVASLPVLHRVDGSPEPREETLTTDAYSSERPLLSSARGHQEPLNSIDAVEGKRDRLGSLPSSSIQVFDISPKSGNEENHFDDHDSEFSLEPDYEENRIDIDNSAFTPDLQQEKLTQWTPVFPTMSGKSSKGLDGGVQEKAIPHMESAETCAENNVASPPEDVSTDSEGMPRNLDTDFQREDPPQRKVAPPENDVFPEGAKTVDDDCWGGYQSSDVVGKRETGHQEKQEAFGAEGTEEVVEPIGKRNNEMERKQQGAGAANSVHEYMPAETAASPQTAIVDTASCVAVRKRVQELESGLEQQAMHASVAGPSNSPPEADHDKPAIQEEAKVASSTDQASVEQAAPEMPESSTSQERYQQPAYEPHCGDLVILGVGVPQEYHGSAAVVTKVAESHCTVVVLDDTRQLGTGECWPGFRDMSLESCVLRLGTHVIINGMTGAKTKHLNGLTGTISEHPREGHPTFVRRPAKPDEPRLTVCVCLKDPTSPKSRSSLLEPRFLTPFDTVALETMNTLADIGASLSRHASDESLANSGESLSRHSSPAFGNRSPTLLSNGTE